MLENPTLGNDGHRIPPATILHRRISLLLLRPSHSRIRNSFYGRHRGISLAKHPLLAQSSGRATCTHEAHRARKGTGQEPEEELRVRGEETRRGGQRELREPTQFRLANEECRPSGKVRCL